MSKQLQVQDRFEQAIGLHQQGEFTRAQAMYEEVLRRQPNHADALNLLGVIAGQENNHQRAAYLISKAIGIMPTFADFHSNLGKALTELGQWPDALASYERALRLRPDHLEALTARGNVLRNLDKLEAALASFEQALAANAIQPEVHNSRGIVLADLNRLEEAVKSYDTCLSYNPGLFEAHYNRGNALKSLQRSDEALASYEKAISLNPESTIAHINRGVVLRRLGRLKDAVKSFNAAISLCPQSLEAHYNRGMVFLGLFQPQEALPDFERIAQSGIEYDFLAGQLAHTKMQLCEWHGIDALIESLIVGVEAGKKIAQPFTLVSILDSPELLKLAATTWALAKNPPNDALGPAARNPAHDKIRIAYYSADFRNHPVAYLAAELFELHDRSRFEVIAFSLAPDPGDAMRKRLRSCFDTFVDADAMGDADIARASRAAGVDIAIDLGGLTGNCRPGIFAHRAAPIQVNFLGYAGTLGADYMDYIVADALVIPPTDHGHYSEKIVTIPCFMPHDSRQAIADRAFDRASCGLPESGFIFCCFNNSYKITPAVFDSWMRILACVPDSVLWLSNQNSTAERNLRREATARGIDEGRLFFADKLPEMEDHLARLRVADLFLDTWPYNAHTTANDALWVGLPLLTNVGRSFASRVAGSLLEAIGMPELITHSSEDYEASAIDLAHNPVALAEIRSRLRSNRAITPLFNTPMFVRSIEAAYSAMCQRYDSGLAPDHMAIPAH